MLLIEIAVSLALAINFMYDYHFFTSDSSIYPIQKAMSLKTEKDQGQIEEYITIYIKNMLAQAEKKELSEQEQASFVSLSEKFNKNNTNLVFTAKIDDGGLIIQNDNTPDDYCYSRTIPLNAYIEGKGIITGSVRIYVRGADSMTVQDGYCIALKMISLAHSIRYLFFVVLFVLVCAAAFLLGLLMSSIGNGSDLKEKKENLFFIDRIPFDLLTVLALALITFIVMMIVLTSAADIKEDSIVLWNAVILILTFVISLILLVYCISLATRIKIGNLLQNTLVYRAISRVKEGSKTEDIGSFKVPILGKALITIGAVMLFELASIFYYVYKFKTCISGNLNDFKFLPFAFIQLTVLFVLSALFFLIVFNLNRVRESGKNLALGDFDSVADSHIMFGDFKAINDDLIKIKDDMIVALQEKSKSQEMRNELITNISHDIKTPLTSIVNYADIISSGKCDENEVKSYSEIITKQSSKLSDLLFNLIEVSKISTGTASVEFDAVNVQVFLMQTIEEFSIKFSEKNLTIETNMPEEDIYILADGLKLWRVFENLLSNIIKYAMPGTRVYLDVIDYYGKIDITLRNISANPISSSPDELLMRFKRDDGSRHTEGNGLGLSIAKSFTEVQNGTFEISVDGDLFKTTITFDRYNPQPEE